jgi:arylformamidase
MESSSRSKLPGKGILTYSENDKGSAWMDISVPLYTGMVHWPDNSPVQIERMMDLEHGDAANVSKIELGAHTGTHMDAPKHFFTDGVGLDEMPLEAAIGPARVIQIEHPNAILPAELEAHNLQTGERVLFRTRNSERCWKSNDFIEDFVYISAAAAQFLVDKQVRTIGIDYLSVGGYVYDGVETHQILLKAGIWLIEGLNLSSILPGVYELVCLPLRIVGADGAPARAILRSSK